MGKECLVIDCSPRAVSCAEIARRASEAGFERATLRELDFAPCDGCAACKSGRCPHEDDAARLWRRLREASVVLFVTPLYFCNFPAPAKAFLDRAQQFWERGEKCGVKFYLLALGGQGEENNFDSARLTFRAVCLAAGARQEAAKYLPHVEGVRDLKKYEKEISEFLAQAGKGGKAAL